MVNQIEIDFREAAGGQSQAEKLRELFLARPGEWLSMVELGQAIGAWAVHSRVADCRRRWNMRIENKTELDPITGRRLSSYRFVR